MPENKLNIISTENPKDSPQKRASRAPNARREESQAKFERIWLQNPEKFNPARDCRSRERINRTWKAIQESLDLKDKKVVDLGCGFGILTLKMRDAGASVDAVDVASNALKEVQRNDTHNIQLIQDWMPKTTLKDDFYDLVLCTEVIAEVHPADFRLFFSEMARIIKPKGYVICSTPVDINAEDSLDRFVKLADTEFTVDKLIVSYHRLSIRLADFFAAPWRFYRGWQNREYRQLHLSRRRGLGRLWYKINSSLVPAQLWGIIQFLLKPINHLLKNSTSLMFFLEKVSRFLYAEAGISHALFVGQRKPIVHPEPSPILGKERIRKWE